MRGVGRMGTQRMGLEREAMGIGTLVGYLKFMGPSKRLFLKVVLGGSRQGCTVSRLARDPSASQ